MDRILIGDAKHDSKYSTDVKCDSCGTVFIYTGTGNVVPARCLKCVIAERRAPETALEDLAFTRHQAQLAERQAHALRKQEHSILERMNNANLHQSLGAFFADGERMIHFGKRTAIHAGTSLLFFYRKVRLWTEG